jgi:hypothetical protein
MDFKLIDKYKNLSDELIQHIINYTDVIVYRHGKYINRIDKKDKRYELLMNIPMPIKIGTQRILIKLLNDKQSNKPGYFIEYIIGFLIKVNIKFVTYENDGIYRYMEAKSFTQFVFDINNNWSKTIYYLM